MLIVYRKSDKEIMFNSGKSFIHPEGMSDENGKLTVIEKIGGSFEDYRTFRLHDVEDSKQVNEILEHEGFVGLVFEGEEAVGYEIDTEGFEAYQQQKQQEQLEQEKEELEREKEEKALKRATQKVLKELIRQDQLEESELAELVFVYPEWKPGLDVEAGDLYRHNDKLYEVNEGQGHTTQADWTPDATPALWKSKMPEGVIPEFVQPTGAHDAYMTGDKVLFNGTVYTSSIDNNTWSPADYPQGWTAE